MERNWPRSGSGGCGSGSNCAGASSGSLVVLRVNNGMLHTVVLPRSDSSDPAAGHAYQETPQKDDHGRRHAALLQAVCAVSATRLGSVQTQPEAADLAAMTAVDSAAIAGAKRMLRKAVQFRRDSRTSKRRERDDGLRMSLI